MRMQAALSRQAADSQQLVEQLQERSLKASTQLAHDQQEFDALFRGWRVCLCMQKRASNTSGKACTASGQGAAAGYGGRRRGPAPLPGAWQTRTEARQSIPHQSHTLKSSRSVVVQEMAAGAEALYLFQGTLGPGKAASVPDEAEPKLRHKLDEAWRAAGLIERHAADLEACLQVRFASSFSDRPGSSCRQNGARAGTQAGRGLVSGGPDRAACCRSGSLPAGELV